MKRLLYITAGLLAVMVVLGVGLVMGYFAGKNDEMKPVEEPSGNYQLKTSDSKSSEKPKTEQTVTAVRFTPIPSFKPVTLTALPLGDKKYSTAPKVGYLYPCRANYNEEEGGAGTQGSWINTSTKTWDATKKVYVDGKVKWPNAKWSVSKDGTTRTLSGNGLPIYHTTGTYPIQSTDDAYAYDKNPNSIKEQSTLTFKLPTSPTLLNSGECIGGEVAITLSGILVFNGFDAGGRDAAAWEVQDDCSGHPQNTGLYHYHSYSKCLLDETESNEHSALIGYAFDGFGLYGLKGEGGVQLATAALDECHGHTHEIEWDGVKKRMYHYHMTRDFPYSVGCFRGKKAVTTPVGGSSQSGQQQGSGMMGPSGQKPPGGKQGPPPQQ